MTESETKQDQIPI